jgi:hypothetical protein
MSQSLFWFLGSAVIEEEPTAKAVFSLVAVHEGNVTQEREKVGAIFEYTGTSLKALFQ